MPTDALAEISDSDLQNARLAARLACGRSHQALRSKRQNWFCFLGRVLKVEADLRGLPDLPASAHAGDLPPGPPAL